MPVPVRIHDRGRVTIPIDVRRSLGLKEGDYVVAEFKPFDFPALTAADGGESV